MELCRCLVEARVDLQSRQKEGRPVENVQQRESDGLHSTSDASVKLVLPFVFSVSQGPPQRSPLGEAPRNRRRIERKMRQKGHERTHENLMRTQRSAT